MKRSFKVSTVRAPKSGAQKPTKGTRELILRAAQSVLARDGFQALTARSVASEAGTNLALLNYHFGSKERLLLDLFDVLDAERITRQRDMYGDAAAPMSEKWRRAVRFYRSDLATGYVRVLQELTAHGYSNALVGKRVRRRMREWRQLIEEVARGALPALGIDVDPAKAASAVASFWLGMEVQHTVGETEATGRYFEILNDIGDWLERQERRANGGGKRHARARAG